LRHSEVVDHLLKLNVDVGALSNEGFTPLHFAAGNGHLAVAWLIRVLIGT
jgi:ankyrin repeat protein